MQTTPARPIERSRLRDCDFSGQISSILPWHGRCWSDWVPKPQAERGLVTTQPFDTGTYDIRCRETDEHLGYGHVKVRDEGAVADQHFLLVRDYLDEPITVRFVRKRGPEKSLQDWYQEVRASASLTPTACFVAATCRPVVQFLQIPMNVGDLVCSRTLLGEEHILGIVCVCRTDLPEVASENFLMFQSPYADLPVRRSVLEHWALFNTFAQAPADALDIAQPAEGHSVSSYQAFIDLLSQMRGGPPNQAKAHCTVYDGVPASL